MEDTEEIFEDALDDVVEATEINISALNNNKPVLSSSRSFKLKSRRSDKHHDSCEDISLEQGLAEAQEAIDLFFNNQFEESREVAQRHCDRSIYHALGCGTFHYLRAVMTFDQEHIEHASSVLSQSVATIDRFRRKSGGLVDTIGKMVRRQDYDSYTEMEIHAELVYAECLLLKAMLTVCEDETLVSFVKAGLKVRQCYMSFRTCWDILQTRDWVGRQDRHKNQFEGGVRLGVGTFNLVMSLLPPRITKLMEFIGFTGSRSSKDAGMAMLLSCYRDQTCLRQFLASIILLGYNLFLTHHTGQGASSDYKLVKEILDTKLEKYPHGAFYLFFQGRFSLVQGHCAEAAAWYLKANRSQSEWPQFHHVACWEMVWAASYRCMWREALVQATRLLEQSRWSPCLYSYLKAAYYCMLQAELTPAELSDQQHLMAAVPGLKQRIAGKSLPMEKFAIRKADRWGKQGDRLTLPGLELVYLWNGFTILGQHYHMVEKFFVIIEKEMEVIEKRRTVTAAKEPYQLEDDCLLLLLKGMCLKYMSAPLAAEECFRQILASAGQLKADKYLAPYVTVELALLMIDTGDSDQAWELLEVAKNSYKDYSLQSRLHFRIHAAQNKIRSKETCSDSNSQDTEVVMSIKQEKGNMMKDFESCTESELKEMMPHI